jgi:hypothetical protein
MRKSSNLPPTSAAPSPASRYSRWGLLEGLPTSAAPSPASRYSRWGLLEGLPTSAAPSPASRYSSWGLREGLPTSAAPSPAPVFGFARSNPAPSLALETPIENNLQIYFDNADSLQYYFKNLQSMPEDQIVFVFSMHGGNVTDKENYLTYITKNFNKIFMYSNPHQCTYSDVFHNIELMPTNPPYCLHKNPTCDTTGSNCIYIPPLMYSIGANTRKFYEYTLGLYMFVGKKLLTGTYNRVYKLLDYYQLLQMLNYDINKQVPMSFLEGIVRDYIKTDNRRHLDYYGNLLPNIGFTKENTNLGLYVCQIPIQLYNSSNATRIENQTQFIDNIPKQNYLDKNFFENIDIDLVHGRDSFEYAVTITPFGDGPLRRNFQDPNNTPITFTALAQQQSQGCALNVLSALGIIPEDVARQQVVCLNNKGTSIFEIYDYYMYYYDSLINNPSSITDSSGAEDKVFRPFFIARLDMIYAFFYMLDVLVFYIYDIGYGIMFKMYQANQMVYGHTVAFIRDSINKDVIWFFDPQNSIIHPLNVSLLREKSTNITNYIQTEIIGKIINYYYSSNKFSEIDLCFTVRNTGGFHPSRIPRSLYTDTNQLPTSSPTVSSTTPSPIVKIDPNTILILQNVRTRPIGGGKNKKMSKSKRKKKYHIKSKPKRKTKKNIKRKTKKNIKEKNVQKQNLGQQPLRRRLLSEKKSK